MNPICVGGVCGRKNYTVFIQQNFCYCILGGYSYLLVINDTYINGFIFYALCYLSFFTSTTIHFFQMKGYNNQTHPLYLLFFFTYALHDFGMKLNFTHQYVHLISSYFHPWQKYNVCKKDRQHESSNILSVEIF